MTVILSDQIIAVMPRFLSSYTFFLYPIPLLIALAATLFLDPRARNYEAVDLVSEILFLGTIHNYLSLGVFLLPGASNWRKSRQEAGRSSILRNSIAIGLILFLFFMWRGLTRGTDFPLRHQIISITDGLISLFAFHHTLWQVKGISLVMNHADENSGRIKQPNLSAIFLTLLGLMAIRPVISTILAIMPSPEFASSIRSVSMYSSGAMVLVVLYLILQNVRADNYLHALYHSRLFAWALVPISKYGFPVALAIHGIEYLFVTLQLYSQQSTGFILRMLIGLLCVGGLMRYFVWEYNQTTAQTTPSLWLMILQSLAFTVGLVHYYWDRILFAMKNPETREFTGRLLLRR